MIKIYLSIFLGFLGLNVMIYIVLLSGYLRK